MAPKPEMEGYCAVCQTHVLLTRVSPYHYYCGDCGRQGLLVEFGITPVLSCETTALEQVSYG